MLITVAMITIFRLISAMISEIKENQGLSSCFQFFSFCQWLTCVILVSLYCMRCLSNYNCLLIWFKCVWSLIFLLGFLGLLGHPSLTHWSSLQRSINFVQRVFLCLDVLCELLLVLGYQFVFISVELSRCFESHFSSIWQSIDYKIVCFD